jgi:hypothetical protein
MVTEIEKKEIMLLRDMKEKYATKWFCYNIEGEMNLHDPDSDLCFVVYVADTEEEVYAAYYPELNMVNGGIASGYDVVFPAEVGGIYVHA